MGETPHGAHEVFMLIIYTMENHSRKKSRTFGGFMERIFGVWGKREAGGIAEPAIGEHLEMRHEYIKKAVEKAAGCEAVHINTEIVVEVFCDEVLWEGPVEVFSLRGNPRASRAYGWSDGNGEGDGGHYTAMLEIPPVTSSSTAVRAAILWEA
jgi:hypothetical protein